MLLYRFLRTVLRLGVKVFYKNIQVKDRHFVPLEGPLIIAANHPNTVMDPLLLAVHVRQRLGFLANASIFAHPVLNWFFEKLHLIPVYRQQDVKAGEKVDNAAAFRRCHSYLLQKGSLLIFPEGTSVHELKLRKLKTGTARIALETAARANFTSGLQLLPVALHYDDPLRFRTKVYLRFCEPIFVDSYAAAYTTAPVETAQALTELLEAKLQQALVVTASKEHEYLLKRLHMLYLEGQQEKGEAPLNHEQEYLLQKEIAAAVMYYELHRPEDYRHIQQLLKRYFTSLDQQELATSSFLLQGRGRITIARLLVSLCLLLFCLPLYLYGLLTNYIPYILPSVLAKVSGTDPEYRAGIMLISGMLFFPLYYIGVAVLFAQWFSGLLLLGLLLLLPLAGFFVRYYWSSMVSLRGTLKFLWLQLNRKSLLQEIHSLRQQILQEVEKASTAVPLWKEPVR